MKILSKVVASTIAIVVFFSCSNDSRIEDLDISTTSMHVVPQEDAISTLLKYINEPTTKSNKQLIISDVYVHYPTVLTKSEECLPDAYLVNFSDDSGFAVLGARIHQIPIIAMVESGHINSDLSLDLGADTKSSNFGDWIHDNISWLINNGISYQNESGGEGDGGGEGGDDDTDHSGLDDFPNGDDFDGGAYYSSVAKMLSTTWSQSSPYNAYCVSHNTVGSYFAGCSTAALAMILRYNHFPSTFLVNLVDNVGSTSYCLNWDDMNVKLIQNAGANVQKQIKLLYGAIFKTCHSELLTHNSFTAISAETIRDYMEELGYNNVEKLSASSFTNSLYRSTMDMLEHRKPVFVSARHNLNLEEWHSWVFDGYQFNWQNLVSTLHCNWGWSGKGNGWFDIHCFNPSSPMSLDAGESSEENGETFNSHYRVITYDIPTGTSAYSSTIDIR